MNEECWLEIDLYWFQGGTPTDKAREFLDRVEPLLQRQVDARKGVSLCVGWLFDSVLFWNGDLDDTIVCCQGPTYEPWTYRRLRDLIEALKSEASRRDISNFHVALILMGIETQSFPESACEGWSGRTEERDHKVTYDIEGIWFPSHPEVQNPRFDLFFFGSPVRVPSDERICLREKPTLGQYFADKLSDLCRTVGLGAVVLRDHIFTRAYIRGHLKGRYMDPESRRDWTAAIVEMLRTVRESMPELILIGYSSGTSAIEEWRSHGFDLEQVALADCLDLWITQTWGSAWGDYWPAHSMGFTFQLQTVLVHQAMLARTKCKHLFLVETFDAWEPWDSIHQYPGKVAWEVWAYSHATVLGPEGEMLRSSGCYISWMNRRKDLLSPDTVTYLGEVLASASADLALKPVPGGPCLVYPRTALEASLDRPSDQSRGEEMDDWAAMLVKYGVPILSITRSEWLGSVEADGFIYPLASDLPRGASPHLVGLVSEGKPLMLMGETAAVDPELRLALGVEVETNRVTSALPSAAFVEPNLAGRIGAAGLLINQHRRTLARSDAILPKIDCLGGPVFAQVTGLDCWIWETPEWGTPLELHLSTQSIESPQTFVAVAGEFGQAGWGPSGMRWRNDDWTKPICFLFWRYPSGEEAVLLANLENGVTGNSQFCVSGVLNAKAVPTETPLGNPGRLTAAAGSTVIRLGAHKGCLCRIDRSTTKHTESLMARVALCSGGQTF